MSDNGWILTADHKPESDKWVLAVWEELGPGLRSLEEDWYKARYSEGENKWYDDDVIMDEPFKNPPIKWLDPFPEPQEDTPDTISDECDALDERARAIGVKMFVRLDYGGDGRG